MDSLICLCMLLSAAHCHTTIAAGARAGTCSVTRDWQHVDYLIRSCMSTMHGLAHVDKGQASESGEGGELRHELQGVFPQLQGVQVGQETQVHDGHGQPVALQADLPQLAACAQLHCSTSQHILSMHTA